MIPNPTPVTTTFNGMWIQNARIIFPQKVMDARMLPYDGSQHLLATGAKDIRFKKLTDEMADTVVSTVQRLADTDRTVRVIHVSAHDPAKPVSITVLFSEGRPHTIRDAFALAATDAEFGALFNSVMEKIAES